jgi:flavin-dependent dehydrogenase
LIIGAGPAGCAAAITLARAGASPLLIDRHATPGDAICGGFLSWETATRLITLGVDVAAIGAHPVRSVALFAGTHNVRVLLPAQSWGLSRRALDTALKTQALADGARFEQRYVRSFDRGLLDAGSGGLFIATGKHDLRGATRPRDGENLTLGLRFTGDAPTLAALIGDTIELHLFDGGYCGLVVQEGGRVNFCMAVRKSALARHGGDPAALMAALSVEHPAFAERAALAGNNPRVDAIGAIPYGWRRQMSEPGLFHLGDQAAVIPSLAGEGIDIALASGIAAAEAWVNGGPDAAATYQTDFAARTRRPVKLAKWLWNAAERPAFAAAALPLLKHVPWLMNMAARRTRIG